MISILSLLVKSKLKFKPWVKVEWKCIIHNRFVPDSVLLENEKKIKSKQYLYRNIKLMNKHPEKNNWIRVVAEGKHLNLCKQYQHINIDKLVKSRDPIMADFIISQMKRYPIHVAMNSNPGLTYFLILNWETLDNNKIHNKNPKLFELIMQSIKTKDDWIFISGRTEIEFAEFLIKNKQHLHWITISRNHNSGLTDFIIENEKEICKQTLTYNENPKLLQLKIKYKDELDWNHISGEYSNELLLDNLDRANWDDLSQNQNPELTNVIISHPEQVSFNYLSRNKNKMLDNFKKEHKDKLDHTAMSIYSNIMEIDKRRTASILSVII